MTTLATDTVVIGAGVCGLTIARRLRAAGRSVVVLEARDRVGGRTWTDTVDGAMLEIGGQWVSPDQTALTALLKELGLETFERYREGESVYVSADGTATRFSGDFPLPPETLEAMDTIAAEIDELVSQVDADCPWEHPQARELDTISFDEWLRLRVDDEVVRHTTGYFIAGAMLTKPPHAFSALQAVLMAASAGSFANLLDENFILDRRVVGGMQQVSERLADDLGDAVHLSHPVRTVRWAGEDGKGAVQGVEVVAEGPDGLLTVTGRDVVLALPPTLYSRISFEPPLPRRQHQMHQHQSFGFVVKVHAVYATPFWRDKGLSGTAFAVDRIVQEVYDNSNHGDTRGTLVGFVSEERADEVFRLSPEERKQTILSCIADYLGPEASTPEVYYESDWGSEEWTRGAYGTSFDLGGLHRYGPDMRTPVGPIRFASSDLAGLGYQHVDGAVRMGERTAEQILAATRDES